MTELSNPQSDLEIPLVVDLDGTLIRSDMLIESLFALGARHPVKALLAVSRLRDGKAAMKAALADDAVVNVANLPYNENVLTLLRAQKARGRRLFIASASDRRYVEAVASHLGLFDGVFGSDGVINLAGHRKAAALCAAFGVGGFDYAGDSTADLDVWAQARRVLVVNASPAVLKEARLRFPNLTEIGTRTLPLKAYVRALRCHQWLKNLLVFVPGLAAHAFGATLVCGMLAFLSFSLCASSAYLLNDLLDLNNDREHPTKSRRPFASGVLPLLHGMVLFPGLLITGLLIGLVLPVKFLGVLVCYYIATLAYSFWLKKKMMLDVVVLAGLYGVRMIAGAMAESVPMSSWLAAFALFLFLCLALIKRSTELIDRIEAGKGDPAGRGYRLDDVPVLFSMAAGSGYVSVLVMALYINSPAVVPLYRHHSLLWLLCVILVYWISRVLLLTHRGEMHDDPVVFAATDRVSLIAVALSGLLILASI